MFHAKKRTAEDIRNIHKNLHDMNIPHDDNEFEREEKRLTLIEARYYTRPYGVVLLEHTQN